MSDARGGESSPAAAAGDGASSRDAATPPAVRAQLLATEHWSLLATRSLIWTEAFNRTGTFLTVVSATVVALALVAQATEFGEDFQVVALLLLPLVLVIGLATTLRVTDVNMEDAYLVIGMNRLRRAYVELAPGLEHYLVTGHHDDLPGIFQTYAYGHHVVGGTIRMLASTPAVLAAVNGMIAGVLVALIADLLGAARAATIVAGVIAGAALLALLLVAFRRQLSGLARHYQPRFPS